MAQEYLPAPSNVRLADLMKEHNISQPELAKEIGCSKSTISRFISGCLLYTSRNSCGQLFGFDLSHCSCPFLLDKLRFEPNKGYRKER